MARIGLALLLTLASAGAALAAPTFEFENFQEQAPAQGLLFNPRMSDILICVGPPDAILKGSNGQMIIVPPAAVMGDTTEHDGPALVLN